MEATVFIVGAGPVGLTCAAFLTHFGVKVRIIDKNEHATQTSNAVAVHARTLELLRIIGIDDAMIDAGAHIVAGKVFNQHKQLAQIDFSKIHGDFPYICNLPQAQTESILLEYLNARNVYVERRSELIDFKQDANGVTGTFKTVQGEQTFNCTWLIGCDGYRSRVREELAIPYRGEDLEFRFLMIDAPTQYDHPLDTFYVGLGNKIAITLFPMKHSVRMIAEVGHHEKYKDIQTADENLFMEIAAQCLPGKLVIDKPIWTSKFWIHERLADHYHQGRVFLAGDAAHAHSPAGGQGMNTGMQDAINLAWKLAGVCGHYYKPSLLDSYEPERRPIAQNVITFAGKSTKMMMTANPILSEVRNFLLPMVTSFSVVQEKMINSIAELTVNYRHSPAVSGHTIQHYAPGDRYPVTVAALGLKHLLVDLKGDGALLAQDFAQVLTVQNVTAADPLRQHELFKALKEGYCLVRPDLYIAYLGNDLNEVANYLQRVSH